ncbi:MAG: TlpA family protein disulfide reductase [Lachnospiraceae bacterium]|nr:TlpA family protein disulfide reductase [Lachnospiraceae bacterium]
MKYAPPEGFALDPQSGRYYRNDGIVNGQQWVTWFDAMSGQYEQVCYPVPPVPAPPSGTASAPPPAAPPQRGHDFALVVIALIVLLGGIYIGHYKGLYSLPFLTDTVNTVSVLKTSGTVDIERASDTLTAREGMRLQDRDVVQTERGSSSWLSLDRDKALGLSELTALRIGQQEQGFTLTLIAGEILAQIDQPLADGESFTVQAGDLALAVRGTVFTANSDGRFLRVYDESGVVAVLDAEGREIALLRVGENGVYETGESAAGRVGEGPAETPPTGGLDATPAPLPAPEPSPTPEPAPTPPPDLPIGIEIGQVAPNFTLDLRGGGSVTLWDLRGMPLLLNVCTTWCPPCQVEFPEVQAVYEAYSGRAQVLGVSIGETVNEVDTYFNQFTYTYPLAYDPSGTIDADYHIEFIPQTWIIDARGVIVDYISGSTDLAAFSAALDKAVD